MHSFVMYLPIRRVHHRLPESLSLPCLLKALPACPQNRIESNIRVMQCDSSVAQVLSCCQSIRYFGNRVYIA